MSSSEDDHKQARSTSRLTLKRSVKRLNRTVKKIASTLFSRAVHTSCTKIPSIQHFQQTHFQQTHSDLHTFLAWASTLQCNLYSPTPEDVRRSKPAELAGRNSLSDRVRSIPALDALAKCLVTAERSDVVAVAARILPENFELIIAKNEDVSPPTIALVEKLWNSLRDINKIFREDCNTKNFKFNSKTNRLNVNGQNQVEILEHQLFSTVVQLNLPKLSKRVRTKRAQMVQYKLQDIAKGTERARPFECILEILRLCESHLKALAQPLENTDQKLRALRRGLFWIIRCYRFLCDLNRSKFKQLTRAFEPAMTERQMETLDLTIRKSVGIAMELHGLFTFARSYRARDVFERTLTVTSLPNAQRPDTQIHMPSDDAAWQAFIESTLTRRNNLCLDVDAYAEQLEWRPDILESQELFRATEMPDQRNYVVHCEAKIMQYIIQNRNGAAYPRHPFHGYIGCSKLSCSACFNLLKAVNQTFDLRLQVKGSHHKVHWPWYLPMLQDIPESKRFKLNRRTYRNLLVDFYSRAQLTQRLSVHPMEDSNPPSGESSARPSLWEEFRTMIRDTNETASRWNSRNATLS